MVPHVFLAASGLTGICSIALGLFAWDRYRRRGHTDSRICFDAMACVAFAVACVMSFYFFLEAVAVR